MNVTGKKVALHYSILNKYNTFIIQSVAYYYYTVVYLYYTFMIQKEKINWDSTTELTHGIEIHEEWKKPNLQLQEEEKPMGLKIQEKVAEQKKCSTIRGTATEITRRKINIPNNAILTVVTKSLETSQDTRSGLTTTLEPESLISTFISPQWPSSLSFITGHIGWMYLAFALNRKSKHTNPQASSLPWSFHPSIVIDTLRNFASWVEASTGSLWKGFEIEKVERFSWRWKSEKWR